MSFEAHGQHIFNVIHLYTQALSTTLVVYMFDLFNGRTLQLWALIFCILSIRAVLIDGLTASEIRLP